jgi:SPP1 gp7 family putative phage head morphogenesis protein
VTRASDPQYWRIRSAEAQQVYDQFVDYAEDDMLRILRTVQRDAELAVRRHEERWSLDHAENQKVLSASELVEHRRNFVEMSRGVTGYTTELNALSTQIQMSRQSALAQQMGVFAAQISEGNLRVATATMNQMGEFAQSYSQFSVETGFKMGVNWDSASPNQLLAMMQTQRQGNYYSDKIWADKDKLVKTLNDEITRGMIQGSSAKEMAERIASTMGTSVSNAMRVVRTETTAIASIAEMNTYAQVGVTEYEYLATLDNRTTKICQDMDGHIIPLKDAELGTTAPPLHPNCRSTTIPHIPDDEFSIPAERAARDEDGDTVYVPEDMSYDDWKKARDDGTLQSQTPAESAAQPTTPPTPVQTQSAPVSTPSPMTPQEAVDSYRGADTSPETSFYAINSALRSGTPLTDDQKRIYDGLVAAAEPLKDDITVYRGTTLDSVLNGREMVRLGMDVQEPGFMSTSTDRTVAEEFAEIASDFDQAAILKILVRRGTLAIDVNKIGSETPGLSDQSELLFLPGSKMTVDGQQTRRDGIKQVDVEIHPQLFRL